MYGSTALIYYGKLRKKGDENSMSAKTRYISKDSSTVMKGLAVIAVILSHLPRVINFPGFIESMLHPLGYLGVAVFLCLSGYGCAMSIIRGGGKVD